MTALDELREAIGLVDGLRLAGTCLSRASAGEMTRALDERRRALARVEAELAALRETNQKLNRRCQSAEQGLAAKLDAGGPSFGRALANAAATMYREQLAERDAELADLRTRPTLEQVTHALAVEYWHHEPSYPSYSTALRAIRALYGEAETTERPNG